MEKLDFEIKLLSNTTTLCPEVRVGIDHITYFAGEVLGEEIVKFTASIPDDFNLNISYEGIDITQIAYNNSKFKIDNTEKYIDNYELTECMDLGLHGVWTLYVESPVYIWILENL